MGQKEVDEAWRRRGQQKCGEDDQHTITDEGGNKVEHDR